MIKKVPGIILAAFMTFSVTAFAQSTDSVKTDTVKVDTTLLNKYRIEPGKNALPARIRPLQLSPQYIPVEMPDYQIRHWRKWFSIGLNFNQAAFSSNWSSGGVSSIAVGTNIVYKTEYNKAPFVYTTEVNFQYGRSKNKGQSARKTNDRLFIDNKLATKLSQSWYFFGALSFDSQVDKGFQYQDPNPPTLISSFLSPGYITESVGFEFKRKFIDILLGTGTARQTLVLNDSVYKINHYGVPDGKRVRNDLAFQGTATFDKDIMQNVHLNAKYVVFIPYGRKLEFVTHRLDLALSARVNKLINVTINATSLYNKDTGPKVQSYEALGLGVMYRFP